MSLFTAEELDDLKLETAEASPELCTISRSAMVSDGRGGKTKTWSDLAADVPCRLDPSIGAARESVTGGKVTATGQWEISLPAGQDVKAADRVTVTSLSNRVFEVIGLRSGSYEVVRIVEATEVL